MMNIGKKYLELFGIVFCLVFCSLLAGCGSQGMGTGDGSFSIKKYGFDLEYNGKSSFEKVQLKTDDLDEIVDLYQEVGDNLEYRDSLLVAEKYAQGLGANAFAQDNMDTLKNQGLTLSNLKKTQIGIEKYGEKINAVLIEYKITGGLISNVPLLYVSQLFIPNGENMILMSFITEDQSSYISASNMFKNIK